MLRKIVTALVVVPLAVVLIAFSVANRGSVTVSFDPFSPKAPAASVHLPLFALIIAVLIIGVIVGGTASWLGQGKWRRHARRHEREANDLRGRLDALQATESGPSIVPREQPPPPRLRLRPPAG